MKKYSHFLRLTSVCALALLFSPVAFAEDEPPPPGHEGAHEPGEHAEDWVEKKKEIHEKKQDFRETKHEKKQDFREAKQDKKEEIRDKKQDFREAKHEKKQDFREKKQDVRKKIYNHHKGNN